MGVNKGGVLVHHINRLTTSNIVDICNERATRAYILNPDRSLNPTIDVDASWLYHLSSSSIQALKIRYVVDVCCFFARLGFIVVVVCDAEYRHDSKQASRVRRSAFAKHGMNLLLSKCEHTALVRKLSSQRTPHSANHRETLALELETLKNEIRKLEKEQESCCDTGDQFFQDLIQCINELTSSDLGGNTGGSISVIQAEYQADSVIAMRSVKHLNDITLCSDSDQAVLCGDHCLSIKKFNINNNTSEKSEFDIFTPEWSVVCGICETINLSLVSEKVVRSKKPVFDQIKNPAVRALIAVGLGCDVFVGGVPGVGPKKMYDQLLLCSEENLATDEQIGKKLIKWYIDRLDSISAANKEQNKMPFVRYEKDISREDWRRMLKTFVQSMLYEPANYRSSLTDMFQEHQDTIYIHKQPCRLHPYIAAFSRNNENIRIEPQFDCCVDLCQCVGTGSGSHNFFKYEGKISCYFCNRECCLSCCVEFEEGVYCVECCTSEVSMYSDDIQEQTESTLPTKQDMIAYLEHKGCFLRQSDNLLDVQDLYEALQYKENILYDSRDSVRQIRAPAEPPSYWKVEGLFAKKSIQRTIFFI